MATTLLHSPIPQQPPTPPPDAPHLSLQTARPSSAPIPNKHIPFCPPGPLPEPPIHEPNTPPDTPPSKNVPPRTFSTLYPPSTFPKVISSPTVYSINGASLANALVQIAGQPLPDPKHAFPWLHGLHEENSMQLAFFTARRRIQRYAPKCFRGIVIVKAGGDLSKARLKGAISADELLDFKKGQDATFLDADPREGFCVRNFQIQTAKMATVSDIVIYGDQSAEKEEVHDLAKKFAIAQNTWRLQSGFANDEDAPTYNTFVLSDSLEEIEKENAQLIAVDSKGEILAHTLDFFHLERQEMCLMSKASEIAHNVWLGPTPENNFCQIEDDDSLVFDILIEANDLATPPDASTLLQIGEMSYSSPQVLEFPSSGSILPQGCCRSGQDPLTRICRWMYKLANEGTSPNSSEEDSEGDIPMKLLDRKGRRILIHCTDGYTETSLLALAYFMYVEQVPIFEAWLRLHCEKGRNFFAYTSDVTLLTAQQPRLVPPPPASPRRSRKQKDVDVPPWFSQMDGSLPSRILPYLYLGNLGHANNPEMLKAMGITQILSVGETLSWTSAQIESWGIYNQENVLFVDGVQDNGVDSLAGEFERCLGFIAKGKAKSMATLVHCRVGVSRSATICIAEVMATLGLSFPRAYCFVRARRLNVIIQPHLRFAYELLKWDEVCQRRRGEKLKREVEWATICREIAGMNRPYASR